MCLICIEFARQRMTVREARRAYCEMLPRLDVEHAREVQHMLDEAEAGEAQQSAEPPRTDDDVG